MKKLLFLLPIMLIGCSPAKYVWLQRKVKLTDKGYVAVGSWQPLDTSKAQPIYQLKKVSIKQTAGYGN